MKTTLQLSTMDTRKAGRSDRKFLHPKRKEDPIPIDLQTKSTE
jgi:hypothetical protein